MAPASLKRILLIVALDLGAEFRGQLAPASLKLYIICHLHSRIT